MKGKFKFDLNKCGFIDGFKDGDGYCIGLGMIDGDDFVGYPLSEFYGKGLGAGLLEVLKENPNYPVKRIKNVVKKYKLEAYFETWKMYKKTSFPIL